MAVVKVAGNLAKIIRADQAPNRRKTRGNAVDEIRLCGVGVNIEAACRRNSLRSDQRSCVGRSGADQGGEPDGGTSPSTPCITAR